MSGTAPGEHQMAFYAPTTIATVSAKKNSHHHHHHHHSEQQQQQIDPEEIISDNDHLTHYDIKKLIGSGEFCDVFKALERSSGRTVALKRLKIRQMFDGKARFDCMREIQLLRKLDHPNIIRHIESFFANSELYIVLEYANAGDLSKMLDYFRKKAIALNEKNVWNFFSQVVTGLRYMHSKRVMHRDLKPANVLINKDGTVKLGDLGLSAILSATSDHARSLVGTPYYMAPERLSELEYTFSADIWSLGCLLYELVTLYPPFYEDNQSLAMLMRKIQHRQYRPVTSYPQTGPPGSAASRPEVAAIIDACLVLEPSARADLEQVYQVAKRMNRQFQGQPSSTTTATISASNSNPSLLSPHTSGSSGGGEVQKMDVDGEDEEEMGEQKMTSNHDLNRRRAQSDACAAFPGSGNHTSNTSSSSSTTQHPKTLKQIYRNLKSIF